MVLYPKPSWEKSLGCSHSAWQRGSSPPSALPMRPFSAQVCCTIPLYSPCYLGQGKVNKNAARKEEAGADKSGLTLDSVSAPLLCFIHQESSLKRGARCFALSAFQAAGLLVAFRWRFLGWGLGRNCCVSSDRNVLPSSLPTNDRKDSLEGWGWGRRQSGKHHVRKRKWGAGVCVCGVLT